MICAIDSTKVVDEEGPDAVTTAVRRERALAERRGREQEQKQEQEQEQEQEHSKHHTSHTHTGRNIQHATSTWQTFYIHGDIA